MANGILDMFGTNFDDPRTQGLLGLSLGLMEAGGWQDRPTTLGQALARGGQLGMQYRQAALQAQAQKEQQAKEATLQDLRMKQLQQQMAQSRAEEARRVQAVRAATSLATGGLPVVSMEAQTPEIQRRVALARNLTPQFFQEELKKEYAAPKDVPAPRAPYEIPITQDGRQGTQLVRDIPLIGEQGQITGYTQEKIGATLFEQPKDVAAPQKPYTLKTTVDGIPGEQQVRDIPIRGPFGNIVGYKQEPVGGFVPTIIEPEKKSGFVSVFAPDGSFYKNVREDSKEADELAAQGYRVVESTQISGTAEEIGVSKPVRAKLEQEIINLTDTEANLQFILDTYQKEFLEVPTRIKAIFAAGKDRFGFASDEDIELVTKYAEFRQNAFEAVNNYIRDVTGAQMSIQEADRLSKAMPQPGTGIFDADSPAEFKRKLLNAIEKIKLARARAAYFLSEGIQPERFEKDGKSDVIYKDSQGRIVSLYDTGRGVTIEKVMSDEADRLQKLYASQNLSPDAIAERVKSDIKRKFAL